jgi:amylosucrase
MADNGWMGIHAAKSLKRLLPRIEDRFKAEILAEPVHWQSFWRRLHQEWGRLFSHLQRVYGWQYDFFFTLEQVLSMLARSWFQRPVDLKLLDEAREANPQWYTSQATVGGVLYVDLFSDNLAKLDQHIPYFKKLGLTYLHLMPLFAVPHGDNDGGYAVSDYRAVNPDIGTMQELAQLTRELRTEGISLVLDFVFNHTANEHIWAQRAKSGDPDFQAFYHMFPDRQLPDRYQRYLRDIFPGSRRGSFTWCEEIRKWVWTTFNSFQWDLNYGNAEVFCAMAEEMLFLANQGVEILRLDAVAFIWKRLGTDCENQPEAHEIIRAFNALARIAAPALLFKSEAIVHPDEVLKYIHPEECQLSYNPLLMALVWEALATGEVKFISSAMQHRSRIPEDCSWVNYLRCHDDIGWTFDDQEARSIGIDPVGHRKFLNRFYTGDYPGSFARGLPFQFNPDNGDLRISGTLASLAGLEKALEDEDSLQIELAVRRINLLRSIMISIGGVPLIYLGDEWGMLNDYTFLSDPAKAGDNRWVHRSRRRWEAREGLVDQDTLEWRFFNEMVRLIRLRKAAPAFKNGGMAVIDTDNAHLFGYLRQNDTQRILVVNNFSQQPQSMAASVLAAFGETGDCTDLVTGERMATGGKLELDSYRFLWLELPVNYSTSQSFD